MKPDTTAGRRRRERRLFGVIMGLSVVVFGGGGVIIYSSLVHAERDEQIDILSTILSERKKAVVHWYFERYGDTRYLTDNPVFVEVSGKSISDAFPERRKERIRRTIEPMFGNKHFRSISYFDASGTCLVRFGAGDESVFETVRRRSLAVLSGDHPSFVELPRDALGKPRFCFVAPIRRAEAGARKPVAAVILEVDPAHELYPIVEAIPPVPWNTFECFLFVPEKDSMLLFSPLRKDKERRFPVRLAAFRIDSSSIRTLRGGAVSFDGSDENGDETLTLVDAIPPLPWSIAVKLDKDEALADAYRVGLSLLFIFIGLTAGTAVVLRYLFTRHRAALYRSQLEEKKAREELLERFEHLVRSAHDCIIVTDTAGIIFEANDCAVVMYGYPLPALKGMSVIDLHTEPYKEEARGFLRRIMDEGSCVYETMHLDGKGNVRAVQIHASIVKFEEQTCIQFIIRDITERKRHEDFRLRVSRLHQVLYLVNQVIVREKEGPVLLDTVCRLLVERGGFASAEIARRRNGEAGFATAATSVDRAVFPAGTPLLAMDEAGVGSLIENSLLDSTPLHVPIGGDRDRVEEWYSSCRQRGIRSLAVFPFTCRESEFRGALIVSTRECDCLGEEETILLRELVTDIVFLLDALEIERKKREANEQVRVERDLLNGILETCPAGILVLGRDGEIMYTNAEAEEMLSRLHQGILMADGGSPPWETHGFEGLRIPEERNPVCLLSPTLDTARDIEWSRGTPDGQTVTLSINVARVGSGTHAPISAVISMEDVTERRRSEIVREKLEDELRSYTHRLRTLSSRLETIQESERRNIARELHDVIGQNLTAAILDLHIARSRMGREADEEAVRRVNDVLGLIEQTAEYTRDVSKMLHPPLLDDYGLFPALEFHVSTVSNRCGLPIALEGMNPDPRLPYETEISLFRIAQESLTNIVKHAGASHVRITLGSDARTCTLRIEDDGKGFTVPDGPSMGLGKGLGLLNMRERAETLGGSFSLVSSPGAGTIIEVRVPRERPSSRDRERFAP
ncbi:MAG: PAS domain S-box protein [Bacteroidota bacterium]|nr:PAS domain S-box protein [Bacteroidota bacterium]